MGVLLGRVSIALHQELKGRQGEVFPRGLHKVFEGQAFACNFSAVQNIKEKHLKASQNKW